MRKKREAFRQWKQGKTEELLKAYRKAKREAKRKVAEAKAKRYEDMYERLGTKEGEKEVYKLARQRERSTRDVEGVKCIKDEISEVLTTDEEIQKRWERYFCMLMNEGVREGPVGGGAQTITVDVEGVSAAE